MTARDQRGPRRADTIVSGHTIRDALATRRAEATAIAVAWLVLATLFKTGMSRHHDVEAHRFEIELRCPVGEIEASVILLEFQIVRTK